MPEFIVTDNETGKQLKLTGDSAPTDAEVQQAFQDYYASQQPAASLATLPNQQSQGATASLPQPFRAIASQTIQTPEVIGSIGSSMLAEPLAGLAGLGAAALTRDPRQGAEAVEAIREMLTYNPQTPEGQQAMGRIGQLMEGVSKAVNLPLSGLSGLTELAMGQGLDQAVETLRNVQGEGFSKAVADRVFNETQSPLLASAAGTTPELAASLATLGAVRAGRAARQNEIAKALAENPRDTRITDYIITGAKELEQGQAAAAGVARSERALPAPARGGDPVLAQIQRSNVINDAIDAGWGADVATMIRGATPADRDAMLRMLNIKRNGVTDALYAVRNRPADVAGNALLDRVRFLRDVNRDAASRLGDVADALKGQQVDYAPAVNRFLDGLESFGVTLNNQNIPNFRGSLFEGVGAQPFLNRIITRMREAGTVDAAELHRLKLYIDENVSYGSQVEGLSGRAEALVKNLRHDLDEILDTNFPEYNEVNTRYAQTRTALDEIDSLGGSGLRLFDAGADQQLGTLMRRLMGNTTSRVALRNSIGDIDSLVRELGGETPETLDALMLFADEMDKVIQTSGRTSFQGDIAKEVERMATQGATPTVLQRGAEALSKPFKKSQQETWLQQMDAMQRLLEQR